MSWASSVPLKIEGPWYRQANHPDLGPLFSSFYRLIWHAMSKLEWDHEIRPVLKLGELPGSRVAHYVPLDGYMFQDAITLDATKVRTGLDAAEFLVHEVVHAWQNHLGYPLVDNVHEENFHDAMAGFGIVTKGKSGRHVGFIGDVWENFLRELGGLNLRRFILSDPPLEKIVVGERFSCPGCGEELYLPD